MDPALVAVLSRAIEKREAVAIVYDGGSQPGTWRTVAPLKLSGTELSARDLESGVAKTFKLRHVRIHDIQSDAAPYDYERPKLVDRTPAASLVDLIAPHRAQLEAMGWHVEANEDALGVHRRFKSGTPQKTPRAGILRRSDSDNGRPWYVFGPGLVSARTFGDLSRAFSLFLDQAIGHPPA